MNKAEPAHKKRFAFTSISLGSIVIGLVCVSLAVMNIGKKKVHLADAYRDDYYEPTDSVATQSAITGESEIFMNKAKPSRAVRIAFTIVSLGTMIIGLAFAFWAMINIGTEQAHLADTYKKLNSRPTEIVAVKPEFSSVDTLQTEKTSPSAATNIFDKKLYSIYPAEGDVIGTLSIPVLKQPLPIIQGTETEDLTYGVGHFIQSVLPGEKDNCVLSGHRGTVFSKLGELKTGDLLIAKTAAGTFTYMVTGTKIVDRNDRTVIVPTDHAVLTLSTCYPFGVFGSAALRFIVSADLVKNS